jgi:hypothetical protein
MATGSCLTSSSSGSGSSGSPGPPPTLPGGWSLSVKRTYLQGWDIK